MQISSLFSQISSLSRVTWLGMGMGGIGIVVALSGFVLLALSSRQTVQEVIAAPEAALGLIMVDVSGAVVQPGVYQLNTGDRWSQAISQAGGLLPQASVTFVGQQLNLAEPVKDGDKLYVPFEDEAIIAHDSTANLSSSRLESVTTKISLNTGSITDFDSLPGIGSSRAEAIIDNRPYTELEELVKRKVISQSVFDQIKGLIEL